MSFAEPALSDAELSVWDDRKKCDLKSLIRTEYGLR